MILLFGTCSGVGLSRPIVSNIPDTVKLSLCLEKAKAFSKASAFDSAIFYYSSARDLYLISGDTASSLKCDYRIIKQISAGKDDTEALNYLIKEGKKCQNWFRDHSIHEAEYHYQIGEKYTDNQKFDSAVISYHRSLPLWLRSGKDSVVQIKNVYKAISYAYSQTGQYDSTIFYDQKSLTVYSAKYGFQNKVAVNSYLGIGNAYFNKGEFDKGIDYFHKALKTNLSLPNLFESDLMYSLSKYYESIIINLFGF